jgi:Na+/phosphate symporter
MSDSYKPEVASSEAISETVALDIAVPRRDVYRKLLAKPYWWRKVNFRKIVLFSFSLYLFFLAITLMKHGARGLVPLFQNSLNLSNGLSALGFGWIFAYVIMSGSPVAAAALTFFDAGVFDKFGAFAMITGSRFGASFIVLLIGFIYILRGRDRSSSLSMGILALLVTISTYVPALIIGGVILQTGLLDHIQIQTGGVLQSSIDILIEPLVDLISSVFARWFVFVVGLAVMISSFSLFDRCLPQMALKESHFGQISRLVYRPVVMFGLGAAITFMTMSVSLSLSILVPLSARGYIRRENVIPYIMGANITTFVDTLLASVLLNNPPAFTIVLVEMLSVAVVSILILGLIFSRYRHGIQNCVTWVTDSNRNLAIFLAAIFIVPLVLLAF